MKAVDHISTYHAFSCMHKRDFKRGWITENDLICPDEFDLIWAKRNQKISERRLEIVNHNGKEMTRASIYQINRVYTQKQREKASLSFSGDKNPTKNPLVVDKIRKTKSTTYIGIKNLDTISAERAAETMKKEYVDYDGNVTTIYKENGKKLSETLKNSDLGKRRAHKKKENYYSSIECPRVIIFNIFDDNFREEMTLNAARKISPALDTKTKEDYLGKSKFGQTILTKRGKEKLIGLYCEIL